MAYLYPNLKKKRAYYCIKLNAMKNFKSITILFLLIGIIFSTNVKSQNLVNPDFEQTDTINSFPFPANWDGDGFGGGIATTSQNGSYAIEIWNWYYYALAYAVNGDMIGFGMAYKAGTPYTQKATKLNGYYRYDTSYTQTTDDSAIVAVLLKKYNTTLQKVDTIGYGITYLTSYSPGDNSFASFEVVINDLQPGIQPDSIVVYMQSSIDGFCSMTSSGECLYLTVDNLSLETPLGLTDLNGADLKPEIFPNPSNGLFTVSFPAVEMELIKLFSIDGKLIHQQNANGLSQLSFDLQGNNPGIYLVEVIDKNGSFHSSKLIIE